MVPLDYNYHGSYPEFVWEDFGWHSSQLGTKLESIHELVPRSIENKTRYILAHLLSFDKTPTIGGMVFAILLRYHAHDLFILDIQSML